jgi:hypothetical protein
MKLPYNKSDEQSLIIGLSLVAAILGSGQFVIQALGFGLNLYQRIAALAFGIILIGMFVILNTVIWKR